MNEGRKGGKKGGRKEEKRKGKEKKGRTRFARVQKDMFERVSLTAKK